MSDDSNPQADEQAPCLVSAVNPSRRGFQNDPPLSERNIEAWDWFCFPPHSQARFWIAVCHY
jgi:hypothetical protein